MFFPFLKIPTVFATYRNFHNEIRIASKLGCLATLCGLFYVVRMQFRIDMDNTNFDVVCLKDIAARIYLLDYSTWCFSGVNELFRRFLAVYKQNGGNIAQSG